MVVRLRKKSQDAGAELTSSPMSPPTGTVIRTSWLYNPVEALHQLETLWAIESTDAGLFIPVHNTLRNSPDLDGRAVSMSGKYCISFFGRSLEGVAREDILVVLKRRRLFVLLPSRPAADAWYSCRPGRIVSLKASKEAGRDMVR